MTEDYLDCQNFELSENQKDILWDIFLIGEDYKDLSSLMTSILRSAYFRRSGK